MSETPVKTRLSLQNFVSWGKIWTLKLRHLLPIITWKFFFFLILINSTSSLYWCLTVLSQDQKSSSSFGFSLPGASRKWSWWSRGAVWPLLSTAHPPSRFLELSAATWTASQTSSASPSRSGSSPTRVPSSIRWTGPGSARPEPSSCSRAPNTRSRW